MPYDIQEKYWTVYENVHNVHNDLVYQPDKEDTTSDSECL